MKIEIVQGGRVLRQYNHEGRGYIEAPPSGDYIIRLSNPTPHRKLAVLSVDGINVVDGEQASYEGPGYVLFAWQTIDIKGWRRSEHEVATFQFKPQEQSYSAKTGKGTSNTGVIGLAVFDEIAPPQRDWNVQLCAESAPARPRGLYETQSFGPDLSRGVDYSSEIIGASAGATYSADALPCSATVEPASRRSRSAKPQPQPKSKRNAKGQFAGKVTRAVPELGTGYGQKATMYTTETTFDREDTPSEVITIQYAVREKLIEWGVPVIQVPDPNAFPAEPVTPAVPAPPGWRG